jgi:capsule polysaccharide modification protein KpsS
LLINPTKAKSRNVYEKSLEEELRDAYCVVAFNSTAALDALKMGVPVICEKYCPAFPLSHAFDQIENLQEKDRLKLFKSLACGQYTFDEVSQTKTFNYLNSIKQWKGDIL